MKLVSSITWQTEMRLVYAAEYMMQFESGI